MNSGFQGKKYKLQGSGFEVHVFSFWLGGAFSHPEKTLYAHFPTGGLFSRPVYIRRVWGKEQKIL